ncbi:MAG: transposase family protein [Acidobacteria bacterium]|nr:transposase family protein [Acidobacteriota bacterium]
MSGQTTSLQDALSQVKDFRNRQGRRYQLQAVLVLACLGLMHGAQSEQAIAEWSENQGRRWWRLLGIRRRRGPSLSTIQRVIRGVDRRQLESAMSHWSHQVVDVSDTPDKA